MNIKLKSNEMNFVNYFVDLYVTQIKTVPLMLNSFSKKLKMYSLNDKIRELESITLDSFNFVLNTD